MKQALAAPDGPASLVQVALVLANIYEVLGLSRDCCVLRRSAWPFWSHVLRSLLALIRLRPHAFLSLLHGIQLPLQSRDMLDQRQLVPNLDLQSLLQMNHLLPQDLQELAFLLPRSLCLAALQLLYAGGFLVLQVYYGELRLIRTLGIRHAALPLLLHLLPEFFFLCLSILQLQLQLVLDGYRYPIVANSPQQVAHVDSVLSKVFPALRASHWGRGLMHRSRTCVLSIVLEERKIHIVKVHGRYLVGIDRHFALVHFQAIVL